MQYFRRQSLKALPKFSTTQFTYRSMLTRPVVMPMQRQPSLYQNHMRPFSFITRPESRMTLEQAERLHSYMEKFEAEHSNKNVFSPNLDNATLLFKELNKHEMYLTAIRLYYKHDLDKNVHLPGFDNMMIQLDYARDHLEGMKALQGNNG